MVKVRTTRTFIQNLAKERLVTRTDQAFEIEEVPFIQKPFLLIKTY